MPWSPPTRRPSAALRRPSAWRRGAAAEGRSGSGFGKPVRALKRGPDKCGLAASAQDFALTQTFTREFDDLGKLGGLGRAARGFAENVPIFGRTILPFTRRPTH